MTETVLTAFIAFVSTNIDDIFILMTLFTQVPHSLERRSIVAGQYMGIIALILLSIAGALIGIVVPLPYIGLLGLFPIYLGVAKIVSHVKNKADDDEGNALTIKKRKGGLLSNMIGQEAFGIAAITIANGGDNIGIYVPLFAKASLPELGITTLIFLALVYVWLAIAAYATSHPVVTDRLKKYNHILFPAVLIGLGVYIIIDSGTYRFVTQL
ncbi:cadmium resistance transporter [Fulvivirgaceae bacterium PWU4]|uniref:Cadmium resistance transporter n=1 Tax=Chryseosolibacter histidini TaxID=2782349 RepID=A0AAP2DMH4_9BACT|nr:cadmium resistance transporter [Chryseosolibacter histidini]MBT1697602.1 cadmium resistance transporter [Chryseosolibacter histidini]